MRKPYGLACFSKGLAKLEANIARYEGTGDDGRDIGSFPFHDHARL